MVSWCDPRPGILDGDQHCAGRRAPGLKEGCKRSIEPRHDDCLVVGLAGHCRSRSAMAHCEGMLMLRLFIGLGIPFIAIVAMLPVVNEVTFTLFNIPALYLWMFSWFVLSSACLGICWLCFDRHRPED
jgi:hypothetical protein